MLYESVLNADHEVVPEPVRFSDGRFLLPLESLGLARPRSGLSVGGMMAVPALAAASAICRAILLPLPADDCERESSRRVGVRDGLDVLLLLACAAVACSQSTSSTSPIPGPTELLLGLPEYEGSVLAL